jgi:magnesium transporter
MINIYEILDDRLATIDRETVDDASQLKKPVWIDFISPSRDERRWAKRVLGIKVPSEKRIMDLESSARFFRQYRAGIEEVHIRLDFFRREGNWADNLRVAFMLRGGVLYTTRWGEDLPQFRLMAMRATTFRGTINNATDILIDLLDADVEYSAGILEGIYGRLDDFGEDVLSGNVNDDTAAEILASISREEDLNSRIRCNMMDTRRACSFLIKTRILNEAQQNEARQLIKDIESVDSHTDFLFERLSFLLEATVGFVNVNQNRIIKSFSVASVALLPPTLIASIYGMNFDHMPELEWLLGYPFALGLMAISVITPYLYFRKKGWLK